MPRHPLVSPTIAGMPRGVFSTVAHRIATLQGEVIPLHIGDTWLEPPEGCHLQDLRTEAWPGLHRYGPPRGRPGLVQALAQRHDVAADRLMVTAGATGGLSSALGALLEPGDEVLILAPFWPLIRGIVRAQRGVAVEVPYYLDPPGHTGPPLAAQSVEERLRPYLSDRTVAVYLNSPNNPSGRVLGSAELQALADFARRHDLWILADEVYEHLSWAPPGPTMRQLAPERTLSAYSFSKGWGMAGNRVGYLLGPELPDLMEEVRKVAMHAYYAAPSGPQLSAEWVLGAGQAWLAQAREAYRQAGEQTAAILGLPAPEGGTFLLVDVSARLDERGMQGFLEDCLDHNLLVAPGDACGDAYAGCVRICFTSAAPEVVLRGARVLRDILD